MTRATRLVLAVSAVVFLVAFAVAQATDTAPLIPTTTTVPYGAEIARETSCGVLRARYQIDHNVWRGGVKDHHDALVEPHLNAMRMVLRRLAWLEERGRCGG